MDRKETAREENLCSPSDSAAWMRLNIVHLWRERAGGVSLDRGCSDRVPSCLGRVEARMS